MLRSIRHQNPFAVALYFYQHLMHLILEETLCMRQGLTKRSSGRYAYGRDYIETVATAAGFHIIEVETIDLRIAAC